MAGGGEAGHSVVLVGGETMKKPGGVARAVALVGCDLESGHGGDGERTMGGGGAEGEGLVLTVWTELCLHGEEIEN